MAQAELVRPARIQDPARIPSIEDLRSWDWRDELRRQEREMTWLARHTQRALTTVYRYSDGSLTPPESWLRDVADLLGVERAA